MAITHAQKSLKCNFLKTHPPLPPPPPPPLPPLTIIKKKHIETTNEYVHTRITQKNTHQNLVSKKATIQKSQQQKQTHPLPLFNVLSLLPSSTLPSIG